MTDCPMCLGAGVLWRLKWKPDEALQSMLVGISKKEGNIYAPFEEIPDKIGFYFWFEEVTCHRCQGHTRLPE